MQESAVQESAVQESAVQGSAVQGSAVQGSARQGRAGRAGILVSDGGRVGVLGSWLRRTPLLIDQGRGGDRLRVHPQGPSRSWKHLMQARGIPTCLRPCLPVLRLQEVPRVEGQQGRLLFAAPFGLLAPLVQRMSRTAPIAAGDNIHPPGESEPSPAMHPDAESAGDAGEDAVFTLSWQADDALLPWL